MTLSKFQQTKCLQIIDKLISWPICSPFVELVDPERDGAPDYLDVVKHPMALKKVQQRINNGEITTLEQFKDDVNLIWSNAKLYNGEDTLFTHMAMEASLWFNEKMKKFPTTQEEEWTRKLQRTTQKLLDVLCHPPAELDPNGSLTEVHDSDVKPSI